MSRVLFTNASVLPWTADAEGPFDGDVLVEDERVVEVSHGRLAAGDARVVNLGGLTLMPGLGDAHVHFGQPLDFEFDYYGAATAPMEDAALAMASVARRYIESGITTCVSGGNAFARADVALEAITSRGWIPGPRIIPGGEFISDPDGIPSTALPTSAVEMRDIVARQCELGVKVVKMFLSGENVMPGGAAAVPVDQAFLTDEMVTAAVEEAAKHGAFVNAHARGASSVARAARCGVRLISHASYVDDEGLALLLARDDVWVCPGAHYLWAMSNVAHEPYRQKAIDGGYPQEFEDALKTITRLAESGVRLLAGGDYGHVWQPHGEAARDLEHFVHGAGMTTAEALRTATTNFAQFTGLPVGQIAPSFFADFLVLDGDPLADVSLLLDRARRRAVIKGGEFVWVNSDELALR